MFPFPHALDEFVPSQIVPALVVLCQLPLYDHRATLSCVAEEGGCHVFWSAVFEPTDPSADDIVTGFYEEGLRALRERYGN